MKNKFKKSVFLLSSLMMLSVGVGYVNGVDNTVNVAEAAETTYSYTFTAKQYSANGTKTLNGLDWTLAGNGGYWGNDSTKGQQFGSSGAPYKSLTFTSTALVGVSQIKINTSGASSVNASFTVSVGDTQVGSSTKLSSTATDYTFKCESLLSGEVSFEYTQTSSKAIYIKSISITYDPDASGAEKIHPLESVKTTSSLGFAYSKETKETEINESRSYTFSNYSAGTQYATNEEHILDEIVTMYTTESHFASELRLYSSEQHNGFAIIESKSDITSLGFNAGNNNDTLNVYGLNESGEYELISGVAVTSSYSDYTVDFNGRSYKNIKLDVDGSQQLRLKSFNINLSGSAVVDVYDFTDVRIRFAATVPAEVFETYDIISAGFEVYAEGYDTPMTIDCTDKFDQDENGDYFIICSIWNIPEDSYGTTLKAYAYFEVVDDDIYFSKDAEYSVCTIVEAYLYSEVYNNLTDDAKGAISAFDAKVNA